MANQHIRISGSRLKLNANGVCSTPKLTLLWAPQMFGCIAKEPIAIRGRHPVWQA